MFPAGAGMNLIVLMSIVQLNMFPAGAGMNRYSCRVSRLRLNVPRRRGDEPVVRLVVPVAARCSPQARG